ncbi:MAG: LPS export ABC transporter ATP-binding protein [Gammaproteobacteria bacterium]|nr:LPS export ABC transporter ATP-binding protein [Gammaproteobacteria bacterium]
MSTLTASKLAKSYKGRHVVKQVSITVESGQVIGLLGPNGAGKTTCFDMIVGLIPADSGCITIDGHDVTRYPMHKRAHKGIGYLPQQASIFKKLSTENNIRAILETQKSLSKKQKTSKLEQLLEDFHITHIRKSLGMSLSGGERRRVEIARALAADPKFILLDEPFAGVDPISVNDIKQIICQLSKREIGVLITDHDVRETLAICEKAYIVNAGEIIEEGNAQKILANPLVKEVYLGEQFQL